MNRVRVRLLSAAALGAALLASGCGTGQIAQTAEMQPAVPGANSTVAPGADNSIQLRNVRLGYPGLDGYRPGATAPLLLHIFNTGREPVTLTEVTTDAASAVTMRGGAAASPSASPAVPPSASPAATPSPGGQPVRVTVPVAGYVELSPTAATSLQLDGLTRAIRAGESAAIRFVFDNGAEYTLDVPVGLPTAPAPRGSALSDEGGE